LLHLHNTEPNTKHYTYYHIKPPNTSRVPVYGVYPT